LFSAKKETTQRIAVLSPLIRRLIQSACLPKKENISLLVLAYHQRRSDDFAFIIIYLNDFAYECLREERKLSYYYDVFDSNFMVEQLCSGVFEVFD
jgi:hypothetical protein